MSKADLNKDNRLLTFEEWVAEVTEGKKVVPDFIEKKIDDSKKKDKKDKKDDDEDDDKKKDESDKEEEDCDDDDKKEKKGKKGLPPWLEKYKKTKKKD